MKQADKNLPFLARVFHMKHSGLFFKIIPDIIIKKAKKEPSLIVIWKLEGNYDR